MGRIDVSTVVRQFKRTFEESSLNELGKATRLCRRERDATPYRLMLALIQAFGAGPLDSIASIHRTFNALCERQMRYKPFHNQLAKCGFAHFTRLMLTRLLNELACSVLRFTPAPESPFARFAQIRIQDGTSFAVKSTLADTFPGRFTSVSPAAVELHVSFELTSETVNQVTLSADSAAERQYLPAPEELVGELLLADRGYYAKDYLRELDAAGGFFIVRAKANMNPVICKAIGPDGCEIKAFRNKPLKALKARLHKYQSLDLDVRLGAKNDDDLFNCRLVVHPHLREDGAARYLVTNLARESFTTEQISDGYRLRWQIELLFKEWKSHSNLTPSTPATPTSQRASSGPRCARPPSSATAPT